MDFCVYMNKNRIGKWMVIVIVVKIFGENSIIIYFFNGGIVKIFVEVYDDFVERIEVIKKFFVVVLMVSYVFYDYIEGFIGEIGFDFGID